MMTDPEVPQRRRAPRRPGQRYYAEGPLRHERPSREADPADAAQAATELLISAGSLISALRKPLKEKGIDMSLARLLLMFRVDHPRVRIGELAWRLGLTTGATTRLVDRADARFLVDRHYSCVDRRGTTVALTRKGWARRDEVAAILDAGVNTRRAAGKAFGIRYYLESHWVFKPPAKRHESQVPS